MILEDFIFQQNPEIRYVEHDGMVGKDVDGNVVEYDLTAAQAAFDTYQAAEAAKQQAAQDKLAKLGLTTEDLKMLLG